MLRPERTPFTLRLPAPSPPVLIPWGYPQPRGEQYAEELRRAVGTDNPEYFGDAKQEFVPLLMECTIEGPARGDRVSRARQLGRFESNLALATHIDFGPLYMPIRRARVQTRTPTEKGYKLLIHFDCLQHLWTDSTTGLLVPLA